MRCVENKGTTPATASVNLIEAHSHCCAPIGNSSPEESLLCVDFLPLRIPQSAGVVDLARFYPVHDALTGCAAYQNFMLVNQGRHQAGQAVGFEEGATVSEEHCVGAHYLIQGEAEGGGRRSAAWYHATGLESHES